MFAKNSQSISDFLWLLRQMKPYLKGQLASIACMLVSSIAALLDPLILKWLIDVIIPRKSLLLLGAAGACMLTVYVVRTVSGGGAGRLTYHVSQQFIMDLRMRLLKHLTRLSADYHDATPVGSSLFVIRDSLDELGTISAEFFPLFLRTIILSVCTILMMLHLNVRLTLMLFPLLPLFLISVRRFHRSLQKASQAVQEEGSATSVFLQEHLSSVTQIQLLAREQLQLRKAFRVWAGLARAGYARKKAEYFYAVGSTLIVAGGLVTLVAYGGLQVIKGTLTVGGLIAFYSYLSRLFEPLYITVEMNSRFQRATACIRRIRTMLDRAPTVAESESAVGFRAKDPGTIQIQNVCFSYIPQRKVLKNINVKIGAGERLALVGPSGCGKSTLARLMARLYDAVEGDVCVDGINVRDAEFKSLRLHVCYLPQRAKLFNGSLADNLRYGNAWTSFERIAEAAEVADLGPVIAKLPQEWKQNLGPGGELLSGGERQRVAIARAVLQRPKVLILDEATSEIDSISEQIVYERLNAALPDTTIIAISHRLCSLGWVDRILVLSDGEIVDQGRHDSLFGTNALYTDLYKQGNPVDQMQHSPGSIPPSCKLAVGGD